MLIEKQVWDYTVMDRSERLGTICNLKGGQRRVRLPLERALHQLAADPDRTAILSKSNSL